MVVSQELITVTVKLFAAYQEAYGVPELKLNVPQYGSHHEEKIIDYLSSKLN